MDVNEFRGVAEVDEVEAASKEKQICCGFTVVPTIPTKPFRNVSSSCYLFLLPTTETFILLGTRPSIFSSE